MTATAFRPPDVLDPFDPVDAVTGAIARLKTVPVTSLDDAALMRQAVELQGLASNLEARRLAVLAELNARGATEVGTGLGTASWLAQQTLVSRRTATKAIRLATELRDRLPQVGARFALGLMPLDMALVAAATVRDLRAGPRATPAETARTAATVATADELLAGYSAYLNADDFALVARRMTAQISAQAAQDSFDTQRERRRLSLSQLPNGSWKLDGLLDPESGAVVAAALDPLSRPLGVGETRPAWQRRADALTELCAQYLNAGLAPTRGTVRPHLNILLDGTALFEDTADPATASDGPDPTRTESHSRGHSPAPTGSTGRTSNESTGRTPAPTGSLPTESAFGPKTQPASARTSAQQLRTAIGLLRARSGLAEIAGSGTVPRTVWERIACDAAIRRVVLDPDAMPLDVGHAHRQPTAAQRAALMVRDGGCAHPGCGRPGAWTDAHHVIHWLRGGPTDLANLILLCRLHHGAIHDGRFRLTVVGPWAVFTDRDGRELGRHRMRAGP